MSVDILLLAKSFQKKDLKRVFAKIRKTLAQNAEFSSTLAIMSASSMHRCTLEVSMKLALIATEVSRLSTCGVRITELEK